VNCTVNFSLNLETECDHPNVGPVPQKRPCEVHVSEDLSNHQAQSIYSYVINKCFVTCLVGYYLLLRGLETYGMLKHEAQNLLGYIAVFLIECRPTFQRYVLRAIALGALQGDRPDDGGSTYL
jgi:hypothetical protein